MDIHPALRELVDSGPLAHLATTNPDGAPQVTGIWVGFDGDDLVSAHMGRAQKIRNLQRDPRFVLSFDAPRPPGTFLQDHAVLRGHARIQEGGAYDVLNRLAKIYVGPDVEFPGGPRPGGFVVRYEIERVGGHGPWAQQP